MVYLGLSYLYNGDQHNTFLCCIVQRFRYTEECLGSIIEMLMMVMIMKMEKEQLR